MPIFEPKQDASQGASDQFETTQWGLIVAARLKRNN